MKKTKLALLVSALACSTAASVVLVQGQKSASEVKATIEATHVSSWEELKNTVKSASKDAAIILDADVTSSDEGSDRIKIDKKKNLTIDLNGHKVSRARTSKAKDGHVFEIQGDSTVSFVNSSENEAIITGGWADNGGGLNIHDGSSVTLENISIKGNEADIDGGAIFTRGTLTMRDCLVENNHAMDTGGAIYCSDDGAFTLENVTFSHNWASDDGGAINCHLDEDSSITGCTFSSNTSDSEDGGAICLDADNNTLTITNTTFSDNFADEYGGAINVVSGYVTVKNCQFTRNHGGLGGAVYLDGDNARFQIPSEGSRTTFTKNIAREDGGVFYNDNGHLTINNADFNQNHAKRHGGVFRLEDGNTSINGATFAFNEAYNDGGVIYLDDDGLVSIKNSSMTDNSAFLEGGAIFFEEDGDYVKIEGEVIIKDNSAPVGPNVYIEDNGVLTVTGSLTNSLIGVTKENKTGTFTTGFAANNPAVSPNTIFFASEGYAISSNGDEASLIESSPSSGADPYLLFPFVKGQGVVDHPTRLLGNNWMSGISGERYLNEINIPGTHDTAMRRCGVSAGTGSWADFGEEYAITQKRYIREQYEAGVRYIDIRLNNRIVVKENLVFANEMGDDGENLWMCHGKTIGGTYFACDENGKNLNLNMVLDYTREFLERNPSECIIMGLSDELYYEEYKPLVYQRLRWILNQYKSRYPDIFYLEGDDVANTYTVMPKLKDVRGKILIEPGDASMGVGGFPDEYYDLANISTCESQETGYKTRWEKKWDDVNKFFGKEEHKLSVPEDGGAWGNQGKMFKIGLNCAPQKWGKIGYPDENPIYHSDHVIEELFYTKDRCFYDFKGKYVGWIKTDGATEAEWGPIWKSNFVQDETDYCTITVNPNLEDPNYQIKTYTVMKNTDLTLPYFNYKFNQSKEGKYFAGWKVNETTYQEGSAIPVTSNLVFTAMWEEHDPTSEADGLTTVDIVWQDSDTTAHNGFAPVEITINGSIVRKIYPFAWHLDYSGTIHSIEVTHTDLITGTDDGAHYRYQISGDNEHGWVITMIRTLNTTIDLSTISGKITWDDQDDYDKTRPSDLSHVQVGYATVDALGNTSFVEGTLVSPTQDPNDPNVWNYQLPNLTVNKYVNGLKRIVAIKASNSWAHADKYQITRDANDTDFTAIHSPKQNVIVVNVRFARTEENAAALPANLALKIYGKVGENPRFEISTERMTGEGNYWVGLFLVPTFTEAGSYVDDQSRTAIDSYEIEVSDSGNILTDYYKDAVITKSYSTFNVLLEQKNDGPTMGAINNLIEAIDALGEPVYTPAYKAQLDAANAAFEALTADQKLLVRNADVLGSKLHTYNTNFAHLIVIDHDIESTCNAILGASFTQAMRDNLNRVGKTLLALSNDERNSLWNYSLYNEALTYAVQLHIVYMKIEALSDVTLDSACKAAIDDAKAAYAALSAEQKLALGNYDDLVQSEAEYFALLFLDRTGPICLEGGESANHQSGLSGVWSDLNTAWTALSNEAKALLNEGEAEENIADFHARYAHIVNRYGDTFIFEGMVINNAGYTPSSVLENSNSTPNFLILSIILSSACAFAIGGAFLARRRRG